MRGAAAARRRRRRGARALDGDDVGDLLRIEQRRRELAPLLARAFAELGYRRATTAELAVRCGVQEKALVEVLKAAPVGRLEAE